MSPEQSYPGPDGTEPIMENTLDEQTEIGDRPQPNYPETTTERQEVLTVDGKGDTRVLDKDEAIEGAYAQKPFVDAKLDNAVELSTEQKELLDWLGSEAAEKAMADYRAGKDQMTEAEQAILERVDLFRTIAGSNSEYSINAMQLGVNVLDRDNPETKASKLEQAKTLLGAVIDIKVAEIMGRDDLSERQKLDELYCLSFTQSVVEEDLGLKRGGGRRNSDTKGLANQYKTHLKSTREGLMLGKIISGLVNHQEMDVVDALEIITEITGDDFDKVFASYKSLIEHSYQEGHGHDIDNAMLRHNYIWSKSQGRFLKLASEQ